MKTSRLLAIGTLVSSFSWLLTGGCSASNDSSGNPNATAGSGGAKLNTGGGAIIDPEPANPGGGMPVVLNPLCGVVATDTECLPDNDKECRGYQPGGAGGVGGAGGISGAGGVSAGGAGGEAGIGSGGQAGAPQGAGGETGSGGLAGGAGAGGSLAGMSNVAGEGGHGGEGGQPGPEPFNPYGCQITRQNDQPHRRCEPAGTGSENAPCFSSADCVSGLACVTEGAAGRCLRYCCSQLTECGADTYCAERQLRTPAGSEPVPVPVCVPADGCSLDEPSPCYGDQCRCAPQTACMLVRAGTTTCLKPGEGQQGEACPCAYNHVCSGVTNQCVKICHTDAGKDECGTQKCQASAELPANFGVCVGPLK